jgi:hypothetical protein
VSQVEETPVLENHHLEKGSEHVQLLPQQNNADDDSDLGSNPSDAACLGDHILTQPAEKLSESSSGAKVKNFSFYPFPSEEKWDMESFSTVHLLSPFLCLLFVQFVFTKDGNLGLVGHWC